MRFTTVWAFSYSPSSLWNRRNLWLRTTNQISRKEERIKKGCRSSIREGDFSCRIARILFFFLRHQYLLRYLRRSAFWKKPTDWLFGFLFPYRLVRWNQVSDFRTSSCISSSFCFGIERFGFCIWFILKIRTASNFRRKLTVFALLFNLERSIRQNHYSHASSVIIRAARFPPPSLRSASRLSSAWARIVKDPTFLHFNLVLCILCGNFCFSKWSNSLLFGRDVSSAFVERVTVNYCRTKLFERTLF